MIRCAWLQVLYGYVLMFINKFLAKRQHFFIDRKDTCELNNDHSYSWAWTVPQATTCVVVFLIKSFVVIIIVLIFKN